MTLLSLLTAARTGESRAGVERTGSGWRLVRRLTLTAFAAALVALHAVLLWERLADLTIFRPGVAVRWAAAALLLWALVRLRRAGVPLLWGRKALVFWLLVVLLHASTGAPVPGEAGLANSHAAGLLYVLPICATVASVVSLGARLLARAALAATPKTAPPFLSRFAIPAKLTLADGFLSPLAPRPPPA